VCACATVELSPERIARIVALSGSAVDWNEFLRLAEHHGLLPLVARNLSAHAHGIPPQIGHSLRSAFDVNLRHNLWFASELARISDHFEKRRLRAIPYKAPLLAESAYGDVAFRNFGDLDLLILPSDFERGKQALAELGYRPSSQHSPVEERFWLRNGYERSFDSEAGKYLVELQWRLLPRFYAVDLPTGDLIARSGYTSMGGRNFPSLSAEDSLLVLCLHAAKHLWMRLIWVCDIAETLRTQALDWSLLRARATQSGILRIVGVSFWLTQRLLDCALPEPARSLLDDSEVSILGEQFAARLARGATYDFESTDYFRLIWKLRERRRDRSRYFFRLAVTPGEGDLRAMNLPEAMFPLYRVVRAARLTRRIV